MMASQTDLANLVSRLENVACKLESLPQLTGAESGSGADSSAALMEFEELISTKLKKFLELSSKIGGDVQSQAELVNKVFQAVKQVISHASKCSKPSSTDAVFKPVSDGVNEVIALRESKRTSTLFNHLSCISESISALGWIMVVPAPAPYIKSMIEAGEFYSNRVIRDWKDKDATHPEWIRAWMQTLAAMQDYVKTHHTTGLTWNPKGPAASPAGHKGSAPPPPGPPPPPIVAPPVSSMTDDSKNRAALFDSINKGSGVTQGLKKVTDDMKTHKNPELRTTSKVAASTSPAVAPKPGKQPSPAKVETPVMALRGNKWSVDYFVGRKDVVIDDTQLKHTVYIYKCTDSVVTVKGKINSIVLDSCKKTGIVFDSLVSSLDIINCQSIQAQVIDTLPIVSIDKTDGAQIYLSAQSKSAEIVTSKSSEMNIVVPKANGDFDEFAVPEQFKTTFTGSKLKTECCDSI